jgi:hypothetical protein
VGVRITSLPMTPEAVFWAIRAKTAVPQPAPADGT